MAKSKNSEKSENDVQEAVLESTVEDVIEDAVLVEDDAEGAAEESDADVEEVQADESNTEADVEEVEQPADPVLVHPMPVPVEPQEKRSIFLPLVLGGIIAAVIGFLASELELIGGNTNAETQQLRVELAAQADQLEAQNAVIKALETRAPVVDLGPLTTLEDSVDQRFATIAARLAEMENRPVVVNEVGQVVDTDAIERELAALETDIQSQRDEISRLISDARTVEEATTQAANTASAQAALIRIISAIESGQPFDGALQELASLDVIEVPDALGSVSAEGVATLTNLQSDFPDGARAALGAARANPEGDSAAGGLGGFLKRQLGARSVAPREGDDPDAVLSRAEAAVRGGDLGAALSELDGLSEETAAPLADWRAAAEARNAALVAAETLSQRLTAN